MITTATDIAIKAVIDAMRESKLSPNRVAILLALSNGGTMRMTEAAKLCGISTAAGTGLVLSMVKAGLIYRCNSSEDLRAVYITITKAGRKLSDELTDQVDRNLK